MWACVRRSMAIPLLVQALLCQTPRYQRCLTGYAGEQAARHMRCSTAILLGMAHHVGWVDKLICEQCPTGGSLCSARLHW